MNQTRLLHHKSNQDLANLLAIKRSIRIQSPLSSDTQSVQSSNVFPPQCVADFYFCVSGAADKRYSLAVKTMPYATCPNCKSTFHLNVKFDALDDWNKKFPASEDGTRYIECYFCWKQLKVYDVVEVWRVPIKANESINKGDLGSVLMIYDEENLEVECVNGDGSSKWLSTIPRNCLWYKKRENS